MCMCAPPAFNEPRLIQQREDLEAWACACPSWISANSHHVMCRLRTHAMLMNAPLLCISMNQVQEPFISSTHVAEIEALKKPVAEGVVEFFCQVELFHNSLKAPHPGDLQHHYAKDKHQHDHPNRLEHKDQPNNTNFLTTFSEKASNTTTRGQSPSRNLARKPSSTVP